MRSRKGLRLAAAATLLIVAAAVCLWMASPPALILRDADTGRVFASYTMAEGDEFTVTFRHSVNKSDETEVYQVRRGGIWLTGCIYYNFGAGVAEVLDPGWTLTYGQNGEMRITGIDRELPELIYVVGTVYDHILSVNGQTIVLNDLCGRNARVRFEFR